MEKRLPKKLESPSNDSKTRSRSSKTKRSRSSKASDRISIARGSKISTSTITENRREEPQNANYYREYVTNIFFESLLDTLIAERKTLGDSNASFSSLSGINENTSSYTIELTTGSLESSTEMVVLEKEETKDPKSTNPATTSIKIKDEAQNSKIPNPNLSKTVQSSSESVGITSKEQNSDIGCALNSPWIFKITFKNGNIYEGQIKNKLMHGKGVFYWTNSTTYEGDFKNGYPWGSGKIILPDLSTYKGDFCMGFFHGYGRLNVVSSPIIYSGAWKIGERYGNGWLFYETNNWYEGDWVKNLRHGSGYRHYKNGARYKGCWLKNKINGEGSMIWQNNDYYVGEWSEGDPHGYGEYTWNILSHNTLAFPNYNWHKGNWVAGKRHGTDYSFPNELVLLQRLPNKAEIVCTKYRKDIICIMNFGHQSGAKLAGTWNNNHKHGPGVMICGNGIMIQRNPLFENDKPSKFLPPIIDESLMDIRSKENGSLKVKQSCMGESKISATKTYKRIAKQVASKEQLESLNQESMLDITRSGLNIKTAQYIKLLEQNTGNAPPLKIPIHNIAENVDLDYFIYYVLRPNPQGMKDAEISTLNIGHIIGGTGAVPYSPSNINYISSNQDIYDQLVEPSFSQQNVPNIDEESTRLKNVIINYLPQLRKIYAIYASLGARGQDLTFEPVLMRLFLWQLYRDIEVTNKDGISLVELDEMISDNPKSCLETTFYPWEPIYFWQFLQSLVGTCVLLFFQSCESEFTPTNGIMYLMFKHFLENRLFPNAGKFQGNCLTHLKDLVPIASVYSLYQEVGEPHSVDEFIKNTWLKKGCNLPCYRLINSEDDSDFVVKNGSNTVVLTNEIMFLEESETVIKNSEKSDPDRLPGLYTFSCLGRKKILKSLLKICPQIMMENGRYYMNYRLSFIEFYEAVLLLSYEKVEQERVQLIEEVKVASTNGIIESRSTREVSKSVQHDRSVVKKKKSKK